MARSCLGYASEQLVFHASPDTAQIDGGHVVEGLRGFIGHIAHRTQDTGIVERHFQLTEGRDRALNHGCNLRLVRHVAGDADRPVNGRGQLSGRILSRGVVSVVAVGPPRVFFSNGEHPMKPPPAIGRFESDRGVGLTQLTQPFFLVEERQIRTDTTDTTSRLTSFENLSRLGVNVKRWRKRTPALRLRRRYLPLLGTTFPCIPRQ
jgi:hypothetical protein